MTGQFSIVDILHLDHQRVLNGKPVGQIAGRQTTS